MTIDEDMARLEQIAKRIEASDVPFEETLTLFEEGTAIAKKIKSQLEAARLRIRTAVEDAEGILRIEELDLQ